jgi:hypothetical protein
MSGPSARSASEADRAENHANPVLVPASDQTAQKLET